MLETVHQSHIGMFLRCPAQFERRYVNGEIIPPGISARRGSSVHKAAEINHVQKVKSHEDLPVDVLQDAARDEYVRLVKDQGVFIPKDQVSEKDKLLAEGLDASTRLAKLYRESLAPTIQPILAEEYLEVDVGLDVPLAGTIDVLTEDHFLEDIKTSNKSKSIDDANNSLQLTFYAGLCANKIGKWPDKTNLRILIDNKVPKLQTLTSERNPQHWIKLIGRIKLMLLQVNAGLFPPCDPSVWWCSELYCGYYNSCKWSNKK